MQKIGICPKCLRHLDGSGHWKSGNISDAEEFINSGAEEDENFYRQVCSCCESFASWDQ